MTKRPLPPNPGGESLSLKISQAAKAAYWGTVEDCLVSFHQLTKQSAHGMTNAFRKKIESPPPGISGDVIYHDEPFYIACDIAGKYEIQDQEILLKRHHPDYEVIKTARSW